MSHAAIGREYRSNGGNGPLRAKVVTLFSDGRVRMYRWYEKRGNARRVYFTTTTRYMESPRCGWKALREPRCAE